MLSAGGCDWRAKHRHAAKRSHLTSEVRGRSQEDPMPEGQQPRGATPRQRLGASERRYPASEVRGSNERSYPTSEVRGGGWEEIPPCP